MPDFEIEKNLIANGLSVVAGTDEAGRGPLAGPVVAAAVILNPEAIPEGINDSKKLTERKREALFTDLLLNAHVSWSASSLDDIETCNIREASLAAMERSVAALPIVPWRILVDGRDVPNKIKDIGIPIIKGDSRSLSIAAASVVAKVMRDRIMIELDKRYPEYGFAKNKGYGTKYHIEALHRHGPCIFHRNTFAPVSMMLKSSIPTKSN